MERIQLGRIAGRCALGAILWLKVAFAAFPLAASPATDLHGVIEIGSKGVKVTWLQMTANEVRAIESQHNEGNSNFKYDLFDERLKKSPEEINTNIILGQENIESTVQAVERFVRFLAEENSVVRQNIHVVYSSSVSSLDYLDKLSEKIYDRTRLLSDTITPELECSLSYRWLVPTYRYDEVLLIDIGSGNTLACYGEVGFGDYNIRSLELLSYGTVSFAKLITKSSEASDNNPVAQAKQIAERQIMPNLYQKRQNHPGLRNSSRVYLLGGIVWATGTFVHPEKVSANWVKISAEDFSILLNRFEKGRGYQVDLTRIPAAQAKLKEKVEKDIAKIKKLFTEEQMIAGLTLLAAMKDEFRFSRKAIFWAVKGRDGWRSQYLIDKIVSLSVEKRP